MSSGSIDLKPDIQGLRKEGNLKPHVNEHQSYLAANINKTMHHSEELGEHRPSSMAAGLKKKDSYTRSHFGESDRDSFHTDYGQIVSGVGGSSELMPKGGGMIGNSSSRLNHLIPQSSFSNVNNGRRLSQTYTRNSNRAKYLKGLTGGVEDEYVKNLQQQIYLLELETRYLYIIFKRNFWFSRRGKTKEEIEYEESEELAAPLQDHFRNLQMKYVHIQEQHKVQITGLKSKLEASEKEIGIQNLTINNLKAEKETIHKQLDELIGIES